jgi:pilus assembly protein CpaE
VVAVYSAKGGTGTTTVAVNAAHCIAANHPDSRVALADLVVSGGDVRLHLDLRPTYDLSSLAEKLDRLDAELLYSLLTNSSGGLWALPAPDNPEFEDTLDASTLGTIVEHLRMHFAFTVLDCEHHLTERTLAALDAADRILLVTQLSVPALRSTQRSIELCRRLGYPEEKLCVVVNRFQSGEVLSLRDAADVLKCEIFWKIPNDYRTSAGALMKGLPVSEFAADSKLAWSFAQLASKLGGNSAHPSGGNGVAHKGSRLARLFRSNRES